MSFDIDVSKRLGDFHIRLSFKTGGGVTALFGPSGSGKTSILNMISGILKPDSGHISVCDRSLFSQSLAINLPVEKRRGGYIFQDARLFPHLSVKRNLLYGFQLTPAAERRLQLEDVLSFLGIDHLLHRWPSTLSGGEAQRVAIGRALLANPHFLLMDEPLSSLDAARRQEIYPLIEQLRDHFKIPILYVSHNEDEVARLANQVVHMPVNFSC